MTPPAASPSAPGNLGWATVLALCGIVFVSGVMLARQRGVGASTSAEALSAMRDQLGRFSRDLGEARNANEQMKSEIDDWHRLWAEAEPRLHGQAELIQHLYTELRDADVALTGLHDHINYLHVCQRTALETEVAGDDSPTTPAARLAHLPGFDKDDVDAWISQYREGADT